MRFYDLYGKSGPALELNWNYNSDNFKSWLMSELALDVAQKLNQWQEENPEELPFDSLFKPKQTRTVIPFKSDLIADKIIRRFTSSGFKIDFEDGTVSDGKTKYRIGKYILHKKSPFNEEEKNWWIHQGDPISNLELSVQSKNYAIVISRNPIDIVRMSDHDGWTSCHSPSREYFQCAISDAKGAGAIAYVIKKSDLGKIKLKSPEIFFDNKRNVNGIKPISRLRLRKFVHKTDGYDLAVPEDRVYGKKISSLESTVRDWAKEMQASKLNGRPSMKEFKLMGGSYQDTLSSSLFNKFFGDEKDKGEAEYGGSDEYESMADQMEEELEEIKNKYDGVFNNCYYFAEVNTENNEPFIWYDGGIIFKIPSELIRINGRINDYYELEKHIRNWGKDNDIYNINSIDIKDGEINISIHGDGNHIDDFDTFLHNLKDVEERHKYLQADLYHLLVQLGHADKNKASELMDYRDEEKENHKYQFANFEWNYDEDHTAQAVLKTPIQLGTPFYSTFDYYNQVKNKFINAVKSQLFNWAENIHKKQPTLFGDYEEPFHSGMKIQPIIDIAIYNSNLVMKMEIHIYLLNSDREFRQAIELISFIDKFYPNFVKMAQNIYNQVFRPQYPQPKV